MKGKIPQIYHTSWWLNQPSWKICSSNWIISPGRGEHKTYLKPPPIIHLQRLIPTPTMIIWWPLFYRHLGGNRSSCYASFLVHSLKAFRVHKLVPFSGGANWCEGQTQCRMEAPERAGRNYAPLMVQKTHPPNSMAVSGRWSWLQTLSHNRPPWKSAAGPSRHREASTKTMVRNVGDTLENIGYLSIYLRESFWCPMLS